MLLWPGVRLIPQIRGDGMDNLFDFIGILSILSAGFLVVNGSYTKDFGKYGQALSRIYLSASLFIGQRIMEYVVLGVLLVVFTDLFSYISWWLTKKYRLQIEYASLAKTVSNLLGKIGSILENPYIGFFTSDIEGNIEFVNPRMLELLNSTSPINIFDYLDKSIVDRILDGKDIYCMTSLHVGELRLPIKLSVTRTENGHTTLTGSVIEDVTIPYNR